MKRTIALLLCAVIFTASFVGCSDKPKILSKEEITEEAKVLLDAAVEVNRIFFWEGLPHEESADASAQLGYSEYLPLTGDNAYISENDLLAKAEAVYTKQYCGDIKTIAFEGVKVTDEDALFARYIVEGGVMKINRKLSDEGLRERIPDKDSIQVVEVHEKLAIVNLSFTRDGQIEKQNVTMRLEENGWRLDTPTY